LAIIVVGGESQVGVQIALACGSEQCLTTSRRDHSDRRVDLFYPQQAAEVVSAICDEFDVRTIFIAAGATNVDWCETHEKEALAANGESPGLIARVANRNRMRVVYFSTDYVFDGNAGPYDESAEPNPINAYGKTKLIGEKRVLDECVSSLVVRSTWVYGTDHKRRNFMYRVLDHDYAQAPLEVSAAEYGTPTWNRDLALAAVLLDRAGCEGVFHVAGPEQLSRYRFASVVKNAFNCAGVIRPSGHSPALGFSARRPVWGGLVSERLPRAIPDFNATDIQSVLDQILAKPYEPS
jgi:dTDP-4-dehydrorhamnose reductase